MNNEIIGTNGNDILDGTDGADKIVGLAGDDQLYGQDGNDKLDGDKGKDTLQGGHGHDTVEGGKDADRINGGYGNDKLEGGRGSDVLRDHYGVNRVDGGRGNDIYELDGAQEDYHFEMLANGAVVVTKVGVSEDIFKTTLVDVERIRFLNEENNRPHEHGPLENVNPDTTVNIDDVISHNTEATTDGYQNVEHLDGVKEHVTYEGQEYDFHYRDVTGEGSFIGGGDEGQFSPDANYFIQGSLGDDKIGGNDGNDRLQGGLGNDRMWGGAGDDIMIGGEGDDTVKGGAGDDVLYGYEGNDYLSGEQGDDTIFGDAGDDKVDGGIGNDTLFGGDGNDHLWGCDGNDILVDESGSNIINGGAGEDTYILTGSQEDYIFTLNDNGDVVVRNAEGAGPDFETTLIDVEQVYFDASGLDQPENLPSFDDTNTVDLDSLAVNF